MLITSSISLCSNVRVPGCTVILTRCFERATVWYLMLTRRNVHSNLSLLSYVLYLHIIPIECLGRLVYCIPIVTVE